MGRPLRERVLVVEDHTQLARLLTRGLTEAGYEVDAVYDGKTGLERARDGRWSALVLDLQLPRLSGMEVLQALRADGSALPVLVLTARDAVTARVAGLDAGADDYLTKPFALEELLARLRALIRRSRGGACNKLTIDDLEVNTASKTARRGGEELRLSAREYAILEYLAEHQGRVVTRQTLLEHIYDGEDEPASNVIDVYVGYLRRKIDR
ncbi:MAG: response regulator transcription factor, partial [Myxococcales bacterium]|nr:response regulator transcription factor [Myxococcales bacterium]